ncbi:MAG: TetR/AcrR family transcriptional regulator [Christensenellales bacterium]
MFYTKGYENTSVQDILDAVGFSKGGFYHHFDSKLAVLEAICQQRAEELSQSAMQAAGQPNLTACEKLNALLASSTLWQSENPGFVMLLIQAAYCENGALMREKMKSCQLLSMQTALEGVLREGVESGDFFVDDVKTTAGLVLRLYMQFTDEIAFLLADEENELQLCDKAIQNAAYRTAIERRLFAPTVPFAHRNEDPAGARAARFREKRKRADDHLQISGFSPLTADKAILPRKNNHSQMKE